MKFLALRMSGALQSWSPTSRFTTRTAGSFPTLSGTLGIVASAMGFDRDNPEGLTKLEGLTLAVRIDASGTVLRDYHTVEYKKGEKKLTDRFYLQNAKFYALLYSPQGQDGLLHEIESALRQPKNILFLGRKSCPPSESIIVGVIEADNVSDALESLPLMQSETEAGEASEVRLDAWIPGDSGSEITLVPDVPVSFDSRRREHTSRVISKISVHVPNPFYVKHHDPMDFAEGS